MSDLNLPTAPPHDSTRRCSTASPPPGATGCTPRRSGPIPCHCTAAYSRQKPPHRPTICAPPAVCPPPNPRHTTPCATKQCIQRQAARGGPVHAIAEGVSDSTPTVTLIRSADWFLAIPGGGGGWGRAATGWTANSSPVIFLGFGQTPLTLRYFGVSGLSGATANNGTFLPCSSKRFSALCQKFITI